MGVFSQVPANRPRYAAFDLSYRKTLTMDMGQLIPVLCEEMVPGDVFKVSHEVLVRFQPCVTPFIWEVNVYIHLFFVPNRLLWDDWEKFITGGEDGKFEAVLPRWVPSTNPPQIGSLWDYFGFPTHGTVAAPFPMQFPLNAYNKVYNDYYRDETLQDEVDLDQEEILIRNYEKDYFTSALPWQQRGDPIALPLTGSTHAEFDLKGKNKELTLPLYASYNIGGLPYSKMFGVKQGQPGQLIDTLVGDQSMPEGDYVLRAEAKTAYEKMYIDANLSAANTVDLTNIGTFSVADIRLAFQTQRFLERNARSGGRYIEFLRAQFGVSPSDDRLQRPEYIGGIKQPVIVSEVLQTSSTDTESPQGNMAGHAISINRQYAGSYRAKEFGVIIGIMSVMPRTGYQQGINRQWLREDKFDFPFPTFANLAEQPVYETELYTGDTEGTPTTGNRKIFGYQGRYNEMRYKPSMVCGLMKTSPFYAWHLSRIFNSAPNLGSNFITCNPAETKRIFAVPSEPGLIVQVGNGIKAIRPIPYNPEPGLIDHF